MSKIRILPEQLANQIAAGEVVERPASVVKELVENSLDAGADRIEIEIEGGGTRLIRIIDNGEGMDEDDVLLCLERHGTSKIKSKEDLAAITSLGFRGEAIPSIASVAKMIITSRRPDDALGTTVICHYGSIKKVHESGSQVGTSIEISNLFGNTPARRKFLRTNRTELSHIDDTVKDYSLVRPDVSFILRIDGRETIRLEQEMNLSQRLAALLNYPGSFITLGSKGEKHDTVHVSGLLVPPESSTPVASRLRFFVNGRAIRDRMLMHAVGEGLRSFMLKGRSPAGVIKVDLPPDSIDINVHPAKHEIRFKDSRIVHQRVCDTVRKAMIDQQQLVRSDVFASNSAHHPAPYSVEHVPPANHPTQQQAHPPSRLALFKHDTPPLRDTTVTSAEHVADYHNGREETLETLEPLQVQDLIVIGTFADLYIFCRNRDKLIVIDQHAAHERLLYENLRKQYRSGKIASQTLLFPVTLELSVFQSQLVEKNLEEIENMGFSLRDFGGNTWIIAAVPALISAGNPQDLFFDVLEQFGSQREQSGGGKLDTILATMACKAAVKSGDPLNNLEIKALLQKMMEADLFSHCPHGRPVVKILSTDEVKKWFLRT